LKPVYFCKITFNFSKFLDFFKALAGNSPLSYSKWGKRYEKANRKAIYRNYRAGFGFAGILSKDD
jgi:hypothetical protein